MPYQEEMREIKRKRKWFYRPPLPRKKQRVTARALRHGKVKHFTEEEIFLYKVRFVGQQLV